MNKWEEVKFDTFILLKRGYDLPQNKAKEGKYPVIASTDLRGSHSEYKAKGPVVTLGRSGSIGKVQLIKENSWPLNTTLYVKDKKGNNIYYIYYFLKTIDFERFNSGAGVPTLNRNHLNSLRIRVPKIEIQDKIVDILSNYDDLIENNKKRIEVLERATEGLYKEWFVRMRFPGFEKTRFVKGIPVGWEAKKVEEIITFDIGGGWGNDVIDKKFAHKAYVIRGTDIPNMKYGDFNYDTLRYHKESNLIQRKLIDGDIIFEASGGSSNQRLGRTIYITDEVLSMYDENVICASFCKLIRLDSTYLAWFFYCNLNYAYKTEILSTYEVQSTGISNFGFSNFKKHYCILVPDENLIKEFYYKTYDMYKNVNMIWEKNQNLIKQRDLLLPRLMNGTIEVK